MGMRETFVAMWEGVKEAGRGLMPYWNGGLVDLQNAVVHAFPDSQQQATVLGHPGVPTPGEVDGLKHPEADFEAHLRQTAAEMDARRSDRGKDAGIDMG